jgi:hypothetical protein
VQARLIATGFANIALKVEETCLWPSL